MERWWLMSRGPPSSLRWASGHVVSLRCKPSEAGQPTNFLLGVGQPRERGSKALATGHTPPCPPSRNAPAPRHCRPQPIALAATFDRALVGAVGAAIGAELRAKSNEAERGGRGPRWGACACGAQPRSWQPRRGWGVSGQGYGMASLGACATPDSAACLVARLLVV